jgi:hypothetical protein
MAENAEDTAVMLGIMLHGTDGSELAAVIQPRPLISGKHQVANAKAEGYPKKI